MVTTHILTFSDYIRAFAENRALKYREHDVHVEKIEQFSLDATPGYRCGQVILSNGVRVHLSEPYAKK